MKCLNSNLSGLQASYKCSHIFQSIMGCVMKILRTLILFVLSLCIYGTASASVASPSTQSALGLSASLEVNHIAAPLGEQYAGIRWIGDKDDDVFATGGEGGSGFGSGGGAVSSGSGSSVGGTTTSGTPNRYECPSTYKTCTGNLYGVGPACNGKYARCRCIDKFKYTTSNCNGEFAPEGAPCTDSRVKYPECKCQLESVKCKEDEECSSWRCNGEVCGACQCRYSGQVCPGGYTCTGKIVCNNICTGSCEPPPPPKPVGGATCPSGYGTTNNCSFNTEVVTAEGSQTMSDGSTEKVTCYSCKGIDKPAGFDCSSGTAWNMPDCGSGYQLDWTSHSYQGLTLYCFKCIPSDCPSGYSTSTKASDCDPVSQYFTTDGSSGGVDCGRCNDITCGTYCYKTIKSQSDCAPDETYEACSHSDYCGGRCNAPANEPCIKNPNACAKDDKGKCFYKCANYSDRLTNSVCNKCDQHISIIISNRANHRDSRGGLFFL